MPDRSLATDVQYLKGVGPRVAVPMKKAGLSTVADVLRLIPRRYEDRRNLPLIGSLSPGDWATVRGRIVTTDVRATRGGRVMLRALLKDRSGAIALTWFNQPWIKRQLDEFDGEIIAYGQAKEGSTNFLEISGPEWETIAEDDDAENFVRIVPVYPLTEGLAQRNVRRAVEAALDGYLDLVQDPLPEWVRQANGLRDLRWSLSQIHRPEDESLRLEARKRLVFDEFFQVQLALAIRRSEVQAETGIAFPIDDLIAGRLSPVVQATPTADALTRAKAAFRRNAKALPTNLFEAQMREKRDAEPLWDQIHRMLPFDLTGAQRRVIGEVFADMRMSSPMNRLIQGDVGSGKTAVAACAILAAIRSGYQAALMAPTEILAEQHHANLQKVFEPLGIEAVLMVGKLNSRDRKRALDRVATGDAHLAVGTHALIQEGVTFAKLGLAIIDEQHRFGVLQRAALREKGLGSPDVLVMTATPIPRTLTMAVFGDLDLSVIDELPPGRRPVKTHWKLPFEREPVYEGVKKLISEGRQAYFVCPMVSESEKMLAQAAEELYERLKHSVFREFRIGLLHGQMKPADKEATMEAFRTHEYDILVSTTVIEVGVDVPNASVMVVEDANRFGLSQLHQLRGRVGRGSQQSYCIMIAEAKGDEARTRMDTMVSTNDGFKIAEVDLRLRGPGMLIGTQQAGNADYRVADLIQDASMLEVARQAALEAIAKDPKLAGKEWVQIRSELDRSLADRAVIAIS